MGSEVEPLVSVVIPVFDDWEVLEDCLDRIRQQTMPLDEMEVIVIDNGRRPKRDQTELVSSFTVVHEPRPGSYAARNAGIRAATGAVIAFTDADCLPLPTWLESGLRALDIHPLISFVVGAIRVRFGSTRERSTMAGVYQETMAFRQASYAASGWGATANLFVRRSAFEEVGVFVDGTYSGGDHEWGKRATSAGLRLMYVDTAVVEHRARGTLKQLMQKQRRLVGAQHSLRAELGLEEYRRLVGRWLALPRLVAVAVLLPVKQLLLLGPSRANLKEIPLRDRLKVAATTLLLQWVHVLEHVRLSVGGRPRR